MMTRREKINQLVQKSLEERWYPLQKGFKKITEEFQKSNCSFYDEVDTSCSKCKINKEICAFGGNGGLYSDFHDYYNKTAELIMKIVEELKDMKKEEIILSKIKPFKKLDFKEANKLFEDIFNRGTQWNMIEEGNEYKTIDKIDMGDDWESYGYYQNKAAKIFNNQNTGWKVVISFSDESGDEKVVDYFDNNCDYDEFMIKIEEVKKRKC